MNDEFLKFQHRVDQRANALAEDLIQTLEDSRDRITGRLVDLHNRYIDEELSDLTFTSRKRLLEHQRSEIERLLAVVYKRVQEQVQDAAQDTINATAKHTTKTLNQTYGMSISFSKLSEKAVTGWFESSTAEGLILTEWLKKLETSTADRIIKASRQSLIEGKSIGGLVKALREQGFEGSYKSLTGLARTSLMSAANYSRETVIEDQFSDLVEAWEYCATLDRRTCMVCASMDGKVFQKDEQRPPLPAHWNCRCVYLPKLEPLRVKGKVIKPEDVARPSKAGSTVEPFKGSYDEWLRSQLESDPDFVKSVLGPGRFELFKSGKLSLQSMVTDGRIKRLDELA